MYQQAIFPVALLTLLGMTTFGQPVVNGSIERQSPDGKIIKVNGGFGGSKSAVIFNWGDNDITEGFFPKFHHYSDPGTYEITLTTYQTTEIFDQITFSHTVPETTSDVKKVVLSDHMVGAKTDETLTIEISAFDQQDQPISLEGRSLEIFGLNDFPNDFGVQIDGGSVIISTGTSRQVAALQVYVDQQPAEQALQIIVNQYADSNFAIVKGEGTASYLPLSFFTTSGLENEDYAQMIDLAFDLQNSAVPNKWDDLRIQTISYDPLAFGASGNPLSVGEPALPVNTGNLPIYFNIIFHEMGHNFHFIQPFFSVVGIPGAFYQETIAEWNVQYVNNLLIENFSQELSPEVINVLDELREANREQHRANLDSYIDQGMIFNYGQTGGGSHPLVEMIYRYSDMKGWHVMEDFMQHFHYLPALEYREIIENHGGVEPEENRVTVMLALLSDVFGFDVTRDFKELDFPLNDELYKDLYAGINNFKGNPAVPELLTPSNDTISETDTIQFSWNVNPEASNYHLQLSAGRYFQNQIFEDNTLTENSLSRIVEPGIDYYWRVRSLSEKESNWSASYKFTVTKVLGISGKQEYPFDVGQNFPNPVSLETTIPLRTNRSMHLTIDIFDLFGRKVQTIHGGHLPPGKHLFKWNTLNQVNGIYQILISTDDNFHQVIKAIVWR